MKRLFVIVVAVGMLGGGAYALTASGATAPQSIYGGGHYSVNFGDDSSNPRDFSISVQGASTAATGTIRAGLNQSGGISLVVGVKCFNISGTPNAAGGRTVVVGGVFTAGPHTGDQVVFFLQDNASPGGPANGIADRASAFFFASGNGLLTTTPKGTTCPDPNATRIAGSPVLYSDVPYGDVVVGG